MNRLSKTIVLALVLLTGCRSPWAGLSRKTDVEQLPGLNPSSMDAHSPESSLAASPQGQSIDALLSRADREMQHGDVEIAKNLYRQVLAIKADQPTAHHRLAIIADRQNDFDAANFHYEFARRSKGNDADLLNDMGYSYYLQGNFQESERLLQQALQVSPGHRDALNNLGQLYAAQGKHAVATALLRQASAETNPAAAFVQSSREIPASTGAPRIGSNLIGDTLAPLYAPELRPAGHPSASDSAALAETSAHESADALPASDVSAVLPHVRITGVLPSAPIEHTTPAEPNGPPAATHSEWNRISAIDNAAAENLAIAHATETVKLPSTAIAEPQSSAGYLRAAGNIDPLESMPTWPPAMPSRTAAQPLPAASTLRMVAPANDTAPASPAGYGQPQHPATMPQAATSPNTLPTTGAAEQPSRSFRDPW